MKIPILWHASPSIHSSIRNPPPHCAANNFPVQPKTKSTSLSRTTHLFNRTDIRVDYSPLFDSSRQQLFANKRLRVETICGCMGAKTLICGCNVINRKQLPMPFTSRTTLVFALAHTKTLPSWIQNCTQWAFDQLFRTVKAMETKALQACR